jgi:hypothetical protein
LGSAGFKAARKMLVKLTNQAALTRADPKSAKKESQIVSLFCTFEICVRQSCSWNVAEIEPW